MRRRRRIVSSKRRVTTRSDVVKRVLDETLLQPECLKEYSNLTGTPYRKSAARLRYEMSERGKLARRGKTYVTVTVWNRLPYRVHIRREEDGLEGYRLERLQSANSNSTGKRRGRRRRKSQSHD